MAGAIVLLLAAVFVIAATSKLRSKDAFRAVLRRMVPARIVEAIAVLVPLAELALATFLLSGIAFQKALCCAVFMLAVFTIVLVIMRRRGIKGCACFGETADTSSPGSGIARNILLIGIAALAASAEGPISIWGPDFSSLLGRLTVVAGALCLWQCLVALVNRRKMLFRGFA